MSEIKPLTRTCYLVSINRANPVEEAKEVIDLVLKLRENKENEKYIVGVELSGDPSQGNFKDFETEFKRARDAGLKITIHCAETKDQMEESQCMIDFKPDRLGHCCFLTHE